MTDLKTLVRPEILKVKAYSSARDEYSGTGGTFLDANENPFGRLNRYPDPHHTLLRQKLASFREIDPVNIFIGNGSDEIIDLTFRIFCRPGIDRALTFDPTYGMYEVAAAINAVELIKVKLNEEFQIDRDNLGNYLSRENIKMLIACSPNNPTGNSLDNLEEVVSSFPGIVLIDEAYIDFSVRKSLITCLPRYPNLIVCQTFSKAFGLAGARVGVAYASKDIIDLFYKVKPPYNVSRPDQDAAIGALADIDGVKRKIKEIIDERAVVEKSLRSLRIVKKVWPSDANFLLFEAEDAAGIFKRLIDKRIIIRSRTAQVRNTLRVTVGSPAENKLFINALYAIEKEMYGDKAGSLPAGEPAATVPRRARVERNTLETSVVADLSLDGAGHSNISTGLGFFDHMLCQIARHGGFDIDLSVSGDLYVDQHHTVEDVALTLGEAFDRALGTRAGIERYGFMLPMDDALAQVAVDFGGRSYIVWDASFSREAIGDMPTEMISHFFSSFAGKARCNLNIRAEGVNEHHKAEAIFKAFARAVSMAVRRNGDNGLPTTKGIL